MKFIWILFTLVMAFFLFLAHTTSLVTASALIDPRIECETESIFAFLSSCERVPNNRSTTNRKLLTFPLRSDQQTKKYLLKSSSLNTTGLSLDVEAPALAYTGDTIPYNITVGFQPGLDGTAVLTDVLPLGTMYVPDSLSCDYGVCSYDAGTNTILWVNNISNPSYVFPDNVSAQLQPQMVILSPKPLVKNGSGVLTSAETIHLALDDGGTDTFIGFSNGEHGVQFLWFNRFTPSPGDFPFILQDISIIFGTSGVAIGDPIDLVIYSDTDGDGDPSNATWLATYPESVQRVGGSAWNTFQLSSPLALYGPGDVIIGVINRYQDRELDLPDYPAGLDTGTTHMRSWVALWTSDPPNPASLPSDSFFQTIDSLGHPGNWMIRGSGVRLPTQVNIGFTVEITSQGEPVHNIVDAYYQGLKQSDDVTTNILYPAIGFSKTVSAEEGVCAGNNQISILQGMSAYYCYKVTNVGNVALSVHDLYDDKLGQLFSDAEIPLIPGSTESYVSSTVIMTDTINTATWTAYADAVHQITASDTATVNLARSDLALTKNGPVTAQPGELILYTITVDNNGPQPATNIIITDTLPTGATFVSASLGCAEQSGVVRCTQASLLNGESWIVQINIMMDSLGDITNSATVKARELDENAGNNVDDWQTELVVPEINVTPLSLSMNLLAGEKSIVPIKIDNLGSGDLHWALIDNDSSWLSENPTSGTVEPLSSVNVNVAFNSTGLAVGVYHDMITITSDDSDEPSIGITVTLVIKSPVIQVTPKNLESTLLKGESDTRVFTIGNTGTYTLTWALTDTDDGWLHENPVSGSIAPDASAAVTVTLNALNTSPGLHNASIAIYSNDPSEPSVTVNVNLNVITPDISVSPLLIKESLLAEKIITTTLSISNTGTSPLTWNLVETVDWISEDPISGTINPANSLDISITINSEGLKPGSYPGSIIINSNDLDELKVIVSIELTVVVPDIEVIPDSLSLTLLSGGKGSLPLVIKNIGTSDLYWSITEEPDFAWLDEIPKSGKLAADEEKEVMISFEASKLKNGSFMTTILVSSNDPDQAVIKIKINLWVKNAHTTYIPTLIRP